MTGAREMGPHGYATIDPDEAIAGTYGTWSLTYVVGEMGLGESGMLRITTDSDTDWGVPQFHDPAAVDYATVALPEHASFQVIAQNWRNMLLSNKGRALALGERITIILGDRDGGSPGSLAQTFQESNRYFWVSVDTDGSGSSHRLDQSPSVRITGGPAARLVVVAPSTVSVGAPLRLLIRAEDRWGNPASLYEGRIRIESATVSIPQSEYCFCSNDGGVLAVEGCTCPEFGVHRITVSDAQANLRAESNPILCEEGPAKHQIYWGEPHGGQLVMADKIAGFFRYARDVAGVDFVGYQRNDNETSSEDWAIQQEQEREYHQPGRFVPLPGFEWSGEPPVGGHHNVYFRRFGQPLRRCSHDMVEDKSDIGTDLPHVTDLQSAYRTADVVIVPHIGGGAADLTYHDPHLEPVIEVTSTHGSFEWFIEDMLGRGYRMGFVGGSDGYTGRPGAEYPGNQDRRYSKGGITAVYAQKLSVNGVLDALVARRCYATTGARILVHVDAEGHPMGSSCRTQGSPRIDVRLIGTAPFESIELFSGLERIYTHPLGLKSDGNRVRITWDGASRKTSYSGVIWDGRLRVSNGRLGGVERLRFDSPRCYVADAGPGGLRWHSVVCGYQSGIVFDLDGGPETELELALACALITRPWLAGGQGQARRRVSYAPAERFVFGCRLGDLVAGPKVLELGPLSRRVTLSLAPDVQSGPRDVAFSYTDTAPKPGINPYWLRIVQSDLEMAWSSPVFVERLGV